VRDRAKHAAYQKLWRAKNAAKHAAYVKAWGARNPVKVAAASKMWRAKNPGIVRQQKVRSILRRAEKLTAIAGRPRPTECELCGERPRRIVFDHCHATGAFRGWLCDRCNLTLGQAKERNALKSSDFALPKQRAYPIHDLAHARDALSRVAQSGTPDEQVRVRAAVHKRYPKLASEKREMSPNEVSARKFQKPDPSALGSG
jgi:hypothetical protein